MAREHTETRRLNEEAVVAKQDYVAELMKRIRGIDPDFVYAIW